MCTGVTIIPPKPSRPPPPKPGIPARMPPGNVHSICRSTSSSSSVLSTPSSLDIVLDEIVHIPVPTTEPHAVVQYPFNGTQVDELNCEVNDIILLKKEVDEQWIYGGLLRTNLQFQF